MINFDKNYFKCIDDERKAYILGFFYADGYNSNRQISFDQLDQDKDILEQIKLAFNSDNDIFSYEKTNGKIMRRLTFSSVDLCKQLSELGGIKNKSLTLKFPDNSIIPEYLIHHFIRGYFDGDGCIWNGKRKKMLVKDSSRQSGVRERIVHNVKFTFTGNENFINSLQDKLVEYNVVNRKTKLNYSKAKNKNNNTSSNVCTMEYSGRKQIKKLFEFMYKDATIYGKRKYNKFLEIFCASEEKSSEDTSINAEIPEMEISNQASIIEEGSTTIPEMGVDSSESKCEAPNM